MTPIPVTPAGIALTVTPCPATPETETAIRHEWQRQASIALAKIKAGDPVKKGTMK